MKTETEIIKTRMKLMEKDETDEYKDESVEDKDEGDEDKDV